MMGKKFIIILTAVILMSASSCAKQQQDTMNYLGKRPTTGPFFAEDGTPLIEINYRAGDKIAAQLEEILPPGSPITVMVFRLRGSTLQTDFAQISTEQVASRIAQKGYAIVADSSRFSMAAVDEDTAPPEKCILAGSYSVGPEIIYMTAAISTVDDGEIMGSWDWTVPLNAKTRSLLPIKDDGSIVPLVNTSGPLKNSAGSQNNYQPSYSPQQGNRLPGFEQNILE
ncbi:hypothetical protein [Maridesulfovibrio ferrireducens]|uniref:hypothetical protein n=1 Tax=Maridesulfovibrio ferrireducens TaxID=246191 RepID=UPI001A252F54|nr:hypothetical protein [Maridesulfovibrio ferrireducens]MBI9112468.1 hypothetical protein [Maridesulfovibrio ferrireducens]